MSRQLNLWSGHAESDDLAARDLVYGPSSCGEGLVFIQKDIANKLVTIHSALESAKTWGEFRASVGPRIHQSVLERGQFDGCYSFESLQRELRRKHPELSGEEVLRAYWDLPAGDRLPLDEDPFEIYSIDGVADGDWPDWPEQLMLGWIPRDVLDEYGHCESSVLNGPFAVLDASREDEIVAALNRRGYVCVRDDELIARCCGQEQ